MALPHFKNIRTANSLFEPVYKNLFEIVITLPSVIEIDGATTILLENATNISLPATPKLGTSTHRFKYSTRVYLNTPESDNTAPSFTINFNLNQNNDKVVETWANLKRWYDLRWNSQTGELHYKQDLIGQVTAHIHDRTGEVIRRFDFINTQLTGIEGFDSWQWDNPGINSQATGSFECDYFVDTYYDVE